MSALSSLTGMIQSRGRAWARRRQGTDRGTIELKSRRIYILPTGQGVAFGAMVFLMLIGSMNYNNSVGLAVTFALTAFALVVMHHCHRGLSGLKIRLGAASPVFAGQSAQFRIELINEADHPRLDLGIFVDKQLAELASLPPDASHNLAISKPAPRRGLLGLDRFSVRCRYPAALFQAWAWINTDLSCVVYPEPAEHVPPPPPHAHADGQQHDPTSGDNEFAGLRDYQTGDPAKRIAWKAYARTNVLAVKTFTGADTAPLELRYADARGGVERRLSILTRWCLDAFEAGRPFALVLDTERTAAGTGRAHLDLCLEKLALHP